MKKNIIIVGDYNREDFLFVGKLVCNEFQIYFLDFLNKKEIKSDSYKKWGKAIFWKDYNDAIDLIDKIKPAIVLFYFIESFNHVALNVACKYRGVKTFHIEHGIRNYEIQEKYNGQEPILIRGSYLKKIRKVFNLRSRIGSRFFLLNTISKLPVQYSDFLKSYFKVRSAYNIFQTFQLVNNKLRIADSYISFSPKIFEFHQKSDQLPNDYPVHFTGCPAFDYLRDCTLIHQHGNDILFIDNAFETQHLFGWNIGNKRKFITELVDFASNQNRKLWIKAHPYSSHEVFKKIKINPIVNFISGEAEFKQAIQNSNIILGFYSTLLMPLMALEHTTCFSLEMHPIKMDGKLSSFLVDSGAINGIDNWQELYKNFKNLSIVHSKQKKHKKTFIDNWLYKFDGKSTERLKTILLGETS